MSGKEQINVSPELTDLPAFDGKKFADEPCPLCNLHLAVKGQGMCVRCMAGVDEVAMYAAFDPELEDVIHGLGSTEVW